MNICLNFYGDSSSLDNAEDIINNYLKDDANTYHILFTTWDTSDDSFSEKFVGSYVKKYARDVEVISNYVDRYSDIKISESNPDKSVETVVSDLYIKSKTIDTINSYVAETTTSFDLVITTTTNLYLNCPVFGSRNVEIIRDCGSSTIFIPNGFNYDIYGEESCSDKIVITDYNNTVKITEQLNELDAHVLTIDDNKVYHPETCYFRYLCSSGLNVVRLFFSAATI